MKIYAAILLAAVLFAVPTFTMEDVKVKEVPVTNTVSLAFKNCANAWMSISFEEFSKNVNLKQYGSIDLEKGERKALKLPRLGTFLMTVGGKSTATRYKVEFSRVKGKKMSFVLRCTA